MTTGCLIAEELPGPLPGGIMLRTRPREGRQMTRTMADRLARSRARTFVGRTVELARFEALLDANDPAVVFVHGPAGIGKSALLGRLQARAAARGAACFSIDARDIPPSLEALELGLGALFDARPGPPRAVVTIDGYELLDAVDSALRERLAPRLPADCLLVLAGRHPPDVGWRSDPGWAPLLHALPLDNLGVSDCHSYLRLRSVATEQQDAAIAFSYGHPLALALVSDLIRQHGELAVPTSADVVKSLVERLLDDVPTPSHRAALEAAAVVRSLNEPLLAALLDRAEVYDLFDWLRSQPYVQDGAYGILLHDLVRDTVASDLGWRHPERHADVHDRARAHYVRQLDSPDPGVQSVALLDLIYLHPELRTFLEAPVGSTALRIEPATPADAAAIVAMVTEHEGPESAALCRHWLAERPDAWSVVRGTGAGVEGALCLLGADSLGAAGTSDPAAEAAARELARHPPLRPGETVTLFRFWLAREDYQSVSAVQSIIATQFARHFLTTHGLAVTIIPFARPEVWERFCDYADQRRAPAADFTVGGRTYTCYAHDWRTAPPAAWLARLSRQEIGTGSAPTPGEVPSSRLLVLDQTAFAAAVRQALRDYSRPDRLRDSPLLRCRLVTARLGAAGPPTAAVDVLRDELASAADTLAQVPADQRLHRVLVRAYLSPAPTLERAAQVLDLPSSTFRRHLAAAVSRITTIVWQRELDA